jgi:methionyl-tRNA formyltransferase
MSLINDILFLSYLLLAAKIFIFAAKKLLHTIDTILKQFPGEIETDGKTFLHFAACDGFIAALDVQLQGKKKMSIQEFLRGNRLL